MTPVALPRGVFAGYLTWTEKLRMPCVVNIGIAPTWEATHRSVTIEIHCLGLQDLDLYDQQVVLELTQWLRPEQRFAQVYALIEQIQQDCLQAQAVLKTVASLNNETAAPNYMHWLAEGSF